MRDVERELDEEDRILCTEEVLFDSECKVYPWEVVRATVFGGVMAPIVFIVFNLELR